MKILIAIISIVLLNILNLYSSTYSINREFNRSDISLEINEGPDFSQFKVVNALSKTAFHSQNTELTLINFPISNIKLGSVNLNKSESIINSDTKWERYTKDGIIKGNPPNIISYEGVIDGINDSQVFINYSNGKIFGFIRNANEQYEIQPTASTTGVEEIIHNIVKVNQKAIIDDVNQFCGTVENFDHNIREKSNDKDEVQYSGLIEIPVAIEGEYYYYALMKEDYDKAVEYMYNVMSLTSRIYEENVNVKLNLSYVLIYEDSTSCPYKNRSLLSQKLYRMPNTWKNRTNVKRSVGVLFADLNRQPQGYRVAGISFGGNPYSGSLCENDYSYCVLGIRGFYDFPTVNYTWDVNVAAHEIGHNFGAPHTHSCYWEPNMIDTCITSTLPQESDGCVEDGLPIPRDGTIMSYCHLTNPSRSVQLFFHERMKPLIRKAAEKAACANEPVEPVVRLLAPLGNKELKSGTTELIRWTYAKVNKVALKYSIDNGVNWDIISHSLNASDSIYTWILPQVTSDSVYILIHSVENPLVSDTSVARISILEPMISIENPIINARIGQSEILDIKWLKVMVNSTFVEFSSDGGNNWINLISETERTDFQYDAPDIVSDKCFIKVTDKLDAEVFDILGPFSIGKETLTIIRPNGGEVLCVDDTFRVVWESEFVNDVWLRYSTNSGESWRKIYLKPIDAKSKEFVWEIPNKISNEVLFSISSYFDNDNYLDVSDSYFVIDTCAVTSVLDNFDATDIISIKPNPFTEYIQVSYSDIEVDFLIINDMLGKTIFNTHNLPDFELNINMSGFSPGSYMLIINTGGRYYTKMIIKQN